MNSKNSPTQHSQERSNNSLASKQQYIYSASPNYTNNQQMKSEIEIYSTKNPNKKPSYIVNKTSSVSRSSSASMSLSKRNNSPIHKALATKIVQYYNTLEKNHKSMSNSRNSSKSRSRSKLASPEMNIKSNLILERQSAELRRKKAIYQEELHNQKKLSKLQDLVKLEYEVTKNLSEFNSSQLSNSLNNIDDSVDYLRMTQEIRRSIVVKSISSEETSPNNFHSEPKQIIASSKISKDPKPYTPAVEKLNSVRRLRKDRQKKQHQDPLEQGSDLKLRNYEEVGKALHQTYNKVMENPLSDPESDQGIKDGKHLKKYKDLINPKFS